MLFRAIRTISFALAFVALVAADYQLPAGVNTCKRDSDDFASCLRLAIQEAWPIFMQGLPDFDIPVMDPYYMESNTFEYKFGKMQGKLTSKDVRTYGLAKARFLSVKPEMNDDFFRLEIDVELPKILIDGDYDAQGAMETFKIGGQGYFNISMEDVRCSWDITGHVSDDRWVVEHFKMVPTVGNMRIWFSDLFNGNEELNRAALLFINEYWPVVFRGMMPKMMEMWDQYLTEFTNRFFSKISFSTVFP